MCHRTTVILLCIAGLLAASLGLAVSAGQPSESPAPGGPVGELGEVAAAVPATGPAGLPAVAQLPRCDCNTSVGLCLQAGQTCQACPCVSLDASKNGICK